MTGREANGQFKKGEYKGGPGRPVRPKEEQYYRILMTACSQKDWEAIVDKAVEQAKRGDAVARKWLADYLIGVPKQAIDVTSGGEKITVRLMKDGS